MPHLTGVFEQFPDLDKISLQNLASWLKGNPDKHALINFLGNRILYPQTIAMDESELEIDLAILREAIRQKPASFFEPQTSKLFIPELFLVRFPPLERLAGVMIEAINPKGLIQIYIKGKNTVKLLGSVISPVDSGKLIGDKNKVSVVVNGVSTTLEGNSLSISKISSPKVQVKIGDTDYSASGGELGVIIDLRTNTK